MATMDHDGGPGGGDTEDVAQSSQPSTLSSDEVQHPAEKQQQDRSDANTPASKSNKRAATTPIGNVSKAADSKTTPEMSERSTSAPPAVFNPTTFLEDEEDINDATPFVQDLQKALEETPAKKMKPTYAAKARKRLPLPYLLNVYQGQEVREYLPEDIFRQAAKVLEDMDDAESQRPDGVRVRSEFIKWRSGIGLIGCLDEQTATWTRNIIQGMTIKGVRLRAWTREEMALPKMNFWIPDGLEQTPEEVMNGLKRKFSLPGAFRIYSRVDHPVLDRDNPEKTVAVHTRVHGAADESLKEAVMRDHGGVLHYRFRAIRFHFPSAGGGDSGAKVPTGQTEPKAHVLKKQPNKPKAVPSEVEDGLDKNVPPTEVVFNTYSLRKQKAVRKCLQRRGVQLPKYIENLPQNPPVKEQGAAGGQAAVAQQQSLTKDTNQAEAAQQQSQGGATALLPEAEVKDGVGPSTKARIPSGEDWRQEELRRKQEANAKKRRQLQAGKNTPNPKGGSSQSSIKDYYKK